MNYDKRNLRGDIIGGITVAIIALPLALAFGISSMPGDPNGAMAGLYGAIFAGIFATLFGGTNGLINGPTGAMIVVLAGAYVNAGLGGFYLSMILAGILQIVLGLLKAGKYVQYIPKPVIVGFTNGIGILIFKGQFKDFGNAPIIAVIVIAVMIIPIISGLLENKKLPKSIQMSTYGISKFFKIVPASLIGLVLAVIVAKMYFPNIEYIREIPSGLPKFIMPQLIGINYGVVIMSAISLCLLASIESLLSAVIVDDMLDQHSNPNKELIGQGIGNFIAPLFGGLIGTGAIVRSAVNVNAGGKTKLSGIIHAIIIFLVVVQFGYVAQLVPMAALAGVLMVTALNMIEVQSIKMLRNVPKSDAFVMIITMLITVFSDLIIAVVAGTAIAAILFTIKVGKISKCDINHKSKAAISIKTVPGPLFFGSVKSLIDTIERSNSTVIILNMRRVSVIDETAVTQLIRAKEKLAMNNKKLILTRLSANARKTFENIYRSENDIIFDDLDNAKKSAELFMAGRV